MQEAALKVLPPPRMSRSLTEEEPRTSSLPTLPVENTPLDLKGQTSHASSQPAGHHRMRLVVLGVLWQGLPLSAAIHPLRAQPG